MIRCGEQGGRGEGACTGGAGGQVEEMNSDKQL